jgi:hypothetical protein
MALSGLTIAAPSCQVEHTRIRIAVSFLPPEVDYERSVCVFAREGDAYTAAFGCEGRGDVVCRQVHPTVMREVSSFQATGFVVSARAWVLRGPGLFRARLARVGYFPQRIDGRYDGCAAYFECDKVNVRSDTGPRSLRAKPNPSRLSILERPSSR